MLCTKDPSTSFVPLRGTHFAQDEDNWCYFIILQQSQKYKKVLLPFADILWR